MKNIVLLALTVVLFTATGCRAQAGEKFLAIQEVTSPGGITAWLVEDHAMPLLSLTFAFEGAGAALDPAGKQGLTQMASNTMDEGAGARDSQAFQKALDDNSISLSFSGGRDDFGGSLKTLTRTQDLAFSLLHDALTAPRFDEEAVERMRAANVARVKSKLADPDWIAARILNDTAFAGHPYALNSGGTTATLAAITPDDLKQFAKTRLSRDRLLVAVTGDIAAKDLGPALDRIFDGLPAQGDLPVVADGSVQGGGETVFYAKDIPQTMIEILQPGMARNDPDWPAFQVMNMIYGGGGFGSRLMEEVREKRGLTYGIYSGPVNYDHIKTFSVSTSTENKNAGEILTIVRQEMDKIRTTPVTDKELAEAKAFLTGSMPLALSSTGAITGMVLNLRTDGLPIDYLDSVAARINAVTAADVQRVAQKILAPQALTVVLVGKPDGVTPTRTIETIPNAE